MIIGVTDGYEKKLELVGVGYKAEMKGKNLLLSLGFTKPVEFPIPDGVQAGAEKNFISLRGANKQVVGEVAAEIRALRPPEPYQGKGIRYVGEYVRHKAGKAAVAGGAPGASTSK
jgi:large subunit ribosomal protein L6